MEEQLIHRACRGDQRAFQQLVEVYHHLVWRTVCILIPERAAAEDAVQEAWIDVWRGLPQFQHDKPFRPWLLTIVANRCRKLMRQGQSLDRSHLSLQTIELDIFAADDMLKDLLRTEMHRELKQALSTLPTEQQRVLELRFFAELELAEIALVTGTSLGTVKSRLHRALNRLKSHLQIIQLTGILQER